MFEIGPLTGNQNVLEPRMSSNSSKNFNIKRNIWELIQISWETRNMTDCTANILTVISTAFGSATCATVIWLYILQPEIAIDLILYSLMTMNVMYTIVVCDNHCQITVAHVTQPMTVNWL